MKKLPALGGRTVAVAVPQKNHQNKRKKEEKKKNDDSYG